MLSSALTKVLCSVAVFISLCRRALVTCCHRRLDSWSPCFDTGLTLFLCTGRLFVSINFLPVCYTMKQNIHDRFKSTIYEVCKCLYPIYFASETARTLSMKSKNYKILKFNNNYTLPLLVNQRDFYQSQLFKDFESFRYDKRPCPIILYRSSSR